MDEDILQVKGDLFKAVQNSKLFSDSKTFVDSMLTTTPNEALKDFEENGVENAVKRNFRAPHNEQISVKDRSSMESYIESLWNALQKNPSQEDTLIPLENSYVVPGGRFRELYYWDSYFTMLGLKTSGHDKLLRSMTDNFSSLIDRFGFIPNGNRIYYLDRSQPPFFAKMITLLPKDRREEFLEPLEKEYSFWMSERTIETEKGDVLNRYWSCETTPRPESYREDTEAGNGKKFYRSIRAACESGWDFSSRWIDEGLESIRTVDIVPVDLNCYLYDNERILSELCIEDSATRYRKKMSERKELIDKYFWDEEEGFYFDYDLQKQDKTDVWSLAGAIPLYTGVASDRQAEMVAENLEDKFLEEGGFVTTLNRSGQQWDYPNGWAPLQWMMYKGLKKYGFNELAETAAKRWLNMNRRLFKKTGKMFEKYNVVNPAFNVEDGEYPVQEGFGWTNGVAAAMIKDLNSDEDEISKTVSETA